MVLMRSAIRWNPERVQQAANRARRRILIQAAIRIRDRARDSMPDRPGNAPPGKPPYMRNPWLRRAVLFAWDRDTQTAVVGPTRGVGFGAVEEQNLMHALEFGGRYRIGARSRKRRKVRHDRPIVVNIPAKPYMAPALERESRNLPSYWRNAIRG